MTMVSIKADLKTSAFITNILLLLERVSYIYYLVQFWKDQAEIQVLIDSKSEINTITPAYVSKLDLKVQATNIKAQKIDDSIFQMFEMVLTSF